MQVAIVARIIMLNKQCRDAGEYVDLTIEFVILVENNGN
jgi:hypothetical protein